jgi:hypothetical protein
MLQVEAPGINRYHGTTGIKENPVSRSNILVEWVRWRRMRDAENEL